MRNLIILLTLFFLTSISYATTINIPADQPTIQSGINETDDGDTVLVQPGTYVENVNFNGKNITVASLYLTTQDTSYIAQTIIDGNQDGHVVEFSSGEDSTAILYGLVITNGYVTGSMPHNCGGGIYCKSYSNPSLKYLKVINNYASNDGGGIFCDDSSPIIENSLIKNNTAEDYGGGIFYDHSYSARLTNSKIKDNFADYRGGGIYCHTSTLVLKSTIILSNSSDNPGGGIETSNSDVYLEDVRISNNTASGGGGIYLSFSDAYLKNVAISHNSVIGTWSSGGGISCSNSDPIFHNVRIFYNTALLEGGGVSFIESNPTLENVEISNNSVSGSEYYSYGGGIYSSSAGLNFKNVTIANNYAETEGGAIYCSAAVNTNLLNCILWNNSPQEIYFSEDGTIEEANAITISYSDIMGGEAGIITNNLGSVYWEDGNIESDPLFVNATNFNYHLTEYSPCIDTGDPNLPLNPDSTRSDMGAYYFNQGITPKFSADTTYGYLPLTVNFTDLSFPQDSILVWNWDFDNDGYIDSSAQNPTYTYLSEGSYDVKLEIIGSSDVDTLVKHDYITVEYVPLAPPTEVQIDADSMDVTISWSAIDSTIYGTPITPDGYIILHNEYPNDDNYFWFLDFTTDTTYIHNSVAAYCNQMYYRVIAIKDYNLAQIEYLEKLNNSKERIQWSILKQNLKNMRK